MESPAFPGARSPAFLGIDPGNSGGIAALLPDGTALTTPMPDTDLGILAWLEPFRGSSVALIEQVTGFIGKRGRQTATHGGQPGSHMFTFGRNVGALRMALVAIGLREGETYFSVTPQTWQKSYGLHREKTESDNHWKNRLKQTAIHYFPDLRVTLKTADSLLIALYAKAHYGERFNAEDPELPGGRLDEWDGPGVQRLRLE